MSYKHAIVAYVTAVVGPPFTNRLSMDEGLKSAHYCVLAARCNGYLTALVGDETLVSASCQKVGALLWKCLKIRT